MASEADKTRLDQAMVANGMVANRSQADSFVRMGKVQVNGSVAHKSGQLVRKADTVRLATQEQYVSRAGYKLASVAQLLNLNFTDTVVLDVGSSTGGFTDYALQHGARHVIAVDVGTQQLHPSLRTNTAIELYEQTDIRDVTETSQPIDIVVIDVSFISLREILPTVARLATQQTVVVAMVKPQFEAGQSSKHKGVIKNDRMRRDILQAFELWARQYFVIIDKADSDVAGSKGNRERFYTLRLPR